jgi:prepilin-type N-terminal cleavage/methylation domain-containing protein
MPSSKKNNKHKKAFSLIELSVVLTVMSIVITSFLTLISAEKELERTTEVYDRMDSIYHKIKISIIKEKRLPCPADPELTSGDVGYGLEDCNNPLMCENNNCSNATILQGSIPTNTLGLSEEMMYDSFGYQFSYVVSVDDSSPISEKIDSNIFSNWGDNESEDKINLTNIQDENTDEQYSLLIISHGENGSGAFYKGEIVNKETENLKEISNSSHDDIIKSTKPDNIFYYGKKTNTFDDIIFFKLKNEMIDLVKKATKSLEFDNDPFKGS